MKLGELFEALNERRAWRWLIAYAAASWGLTEATGFLIDNYGLSRTLLDVLLFLILVFLPIVLTLVWFHGAKGHQRVTRVEGIILAVLLAAGAIGSVWIATGEAPPSAAALAAEEPVVDLGEGSVAVLPFNNSIEDGNLGWLDRGLAELIATHLAQLDGLKVVSAQRISDLLRQNGMGELRQVPVGLEPQITRLAGARMMVTGSVYGRPESLAITANLADARTGEILASANARGSDVFAVVDSIALAMSRQISGAPVEPTELASAAQLTTTSVDAYREYQAGREAFARFLDREAEGHFRRAVELDPAFALAHFRLGMSLGRLGNPSEAFEHFALARESLTAVSERDSLFIEGVWASGFEPERADATLRELIRKYPDEKEARVIFASILDNRDTELARAELRNILQETIRLDPLHAAAYNQLAYVHAAEGDYEGADSLIRQYVELEPDLPNPYDSQGEILEFSGRFSEARDAYRQALRLRDDFRPSLEHLARSYLKENKPVEGRGELQGYLDSPALDMRVTAGILVGDTHMWQGAVERGLASYERADRAAVEAGRSDLRGRPLNQIIQTHITFQEFGEASAAYDTLRQFEPLADSWIWIGLDSLRGAGDVAGLEALKAEAVARYSDDAFPPQVQGILSTVVDMEIAFVEGEYQRVLDLYGQLPDQFDGDVPGWIVIRSLLELGLAERAVQMLERLANPDILDGVARIDPLPWRQGEYFAARAYEALGDTAAAVGVYERLVGGFGDAVGQIPLMADAPERLEALQAGVDAAAGSESSTGGHP
jgi:tetratricopeptide (TPR) repeat protein